MDVMRSKQIVSFFRFMRLFRISFFSLLEVKAEKIRALVAWQDDCHDGIPDVENTQEVVWTYGAEKSIEEALDVGEYAYDAGLIKSDRITVEPSDIARQFGWDSSRAVAALDILLQIHVRMIDDGKEGDGFLLHR